MNKTNELEKLLRSWTPRRPSKALEARLFGRVEPTAEEALPDFRLSWLAPAAVAVVLLCVLFNQRFGAGLTGSVPSGPMVAMILSNQSAATYLAGSGQSEQNNLPADAFKWTHGKAAMARLTAVPPGKRDD
jgi:hypothetical protein